MINDYFLGKKINPGYHLICLTKRSSNYYSQTLIFNCYEIVSKLFSSLPIPRLFQFLLSTCLTTVCGCCMKMRQVSFCLQAFLETMSDKTSLISGNYMCLRNNVYLYFCLCKIQETKKY